MLIDEGLEFLEVDEVMRLLSTGEIGRVGVSVGAMPAIFPVNYRVIDGAIVFRTSPGTKLLAAANGSVVAFEVDEFDLQRREGWSVLVVGRSEIVHGLRATFDVLDSGLEPFVDGPRAAIVRIEPTFASGRRIVRVSDAPEH